MLQGSGDTDARSRRLRSAMSLPEVLLSQALRTRPAGPYTAGSYCHEARLVIEVDGEAHERGDRPARDAARDCWLGERSIRMLRIGVRDVLGDRDGVMRGVVDAASSPGTE